MCVEAVTASILSYVTNEESKSTMGCQVAVPATLIDQAAERFRLLSDPTRLRLLNELDLHEELAVGELAERSGVTPRTIR